jgi:hypothetical protein
MASPTGGVELDYTLLMNVTDTYPTGLPPFMQFTTRKMIMTIVYILLFVVALIGNSVMFCVLVRNVFTGTSAHVFVAHDFFTRK